MKIYKWDPIWGVKNKILYLGAKFEKDKPFFLWKCDLYHKKKIVFSPPKGSRLCAGSFYKKKFFGSLSYDYLINEEIPHIDQSIFACDEKFNITSEFRPSKFLKNKNKLFSEKLFNNKLIIPFRDPAPLNQDNKFAVCTGGFRWGGINGNICEVQFENNNFSITRETIIDENMRIFSEIERVTFWNEFMFFSVNGGLASQNKIQVAILNKNGLYKYYGDIENSGGLYGPCVNKELKMLYWVNGKYEINYPLFKNLFYKNKKWYLKRSILEKFSKNNLYQNLKKIRSKYF